MQSTAPRCTRNTWRLFIGCPWCGQEISSRRQKPREWLGESWFIQSQVLACTLYSKKSQILTFSERYVAEIMNEIAKIRSVCGDLISYDWIRQGISHIFTVTIVYQPSGGFIAVFPWYTRSLWLWPCTLTLRPPCSEGNMSWTTLNSPPHIR